MKLDGVQFLLFIIIIYVFFLPFTAQSLCQSLKKKNQFETPIKNNHQHDLSAKSVYQDLQHAPPMQGNSASPADYYSNQHLR